MASQNERDKIAIRTLLEQLVAATYQDIALRGGEGLASPLMEMVQAGEVSRETRDGQPSLYRLASSVTGREE